MLLITGFEPFTTRDGRALQYNCTADLATALAEGHPDRRAAVLPVAFGTTPQVLDDLLSELRPDTWLGLGLATRRTTITIEVVALNVEHAVSPDNAGERATDRPIRRGGPLAYRTSFDAAALAARLATEGHPVELSHHAGTFLCNQTYYLACDRAATTGVPRHALFVHVPDPEGASEHGVDRETLRAALDRLANLL